MSNHPTQHAYRVDSKIKYRHMDKFLEDRVKCLEEQRNGLINCMKVALSLTTEKEVIHYLETVIKREEEKHVYNK